MEDVKRFLGWIEDDSICAAPGVKLELRRTQVVQHVAVEIRYRSQAGRIVRAPRVQVIREGGLSETTFTCRQTRVFEKQIP